MFKKCTIKKHEIAVKYRHGDICGVLLPGSHWFKRLHCRVQVFDRLNPLIDCAEKELFSLEPKLAKYLIIIRLEEHQRGFVWQENRLGWLLGPGLHLFWREPFNLNVEIFDIHTEPFKHPKMESILSHPDHRTFFHRFQVAGHQYGIHMVNKVINRALPSGEFFFWKQGQDQELLLLDRWEQLLDVSGQEIMTADKVTLRINLLVGYRIVDCMVAARSTADPIQALYRASQMILRAAVGTRQLDKLLTEKESLGREIQQNLNMRAAELGIELTSVGVRDIILPGDMKQLLNQVIEAEKRAQANLIRRREETAAARSQANTAKILADNPVLKKMKELEVLQDILNGSKSTFIFGNGNLTQSFREMLATKES